MLVQFPGRMPGLPTVPLNRLVDDRVYYIRKTDLMDALSQVIEDVYEFIT